MRGLRLIALRERLLRAAAVLLVAAAFPAGAALAACDDCPEHRHGQPGAPASVVGGAHHAMTASDEEPAQRAALTTAQATRRLSKRCRTLVRKQRPSKLSERNRKARRTCLKQRAKLIRDSRQAGTPGTPVPPTSPVPTVPGPAAPGQPAPAPVEPALPPQAPTGPKYAAVGMRAYDDNGLSKFSQTRRTVAADIVVFQLANSDRQGHNLFIRRLGDAASQVAILAWVPAGVTQTAEVPLAPGEYELVCIVPGHEAMTVPFTVVAPTA